MDLLKQFVVALLLVGGIAHAVETPGAVGSNVRGQLGTNGEMNSSLPVPMATDVSFRLLAGGTYHSLGIDYTGRLYGWGDGSSSCLGPVGQVNLVPALLFGDGLPLGSAVQAVDGGYYFTIALLQDGRVATWGRNDQGQLGNAAIGDASTPYAIPFDNPAVSVSAGTYHALACDSQGAVFAWGRNAEGQLGDGRNNPAYTPERVAGLAPARQVAAGENFSLALLADGTVAAWGTNGNGQLGTGNLTPNFTPAVISGLSHVKAIATGRFSCLALLEDGTVSAWGAYFSDRPAPIRGVNGVTAIAAKGTHYILLCADGSVRTLGYNDYGEVGIGTMDPTFTPVKPIGLPAITAIGASVDASFFAPSGTPTILGQAASSFVGPSGPVQEFQATLANTTTGGTVEFFAGDLSLGTQNVSADAQPILFVPIPGRLLGHTTYEFHVVARNAAGLQTDHSAPTAFTTPDTPPVLQTATFQLGHEGTATISEDALRALAHDADGDELSFELSNPSGGTISAVNGPNGWTWVFTASDDWSVNGSGSFMVRASDAFGGTSALITMSVADTLAPSLALSSTPQTEFHQADLLPDFRGIVNAADNAPGLTLSQTPAAQSALPLGDSMVTLTARDAAGNVTSQSFTILTLPDEAHLATAIGAGDSLPRGPGGIASGVYRRFGAPSINSSGMLAYRAWAQVARHVEESIVAGGQVIAQAGDPAPDARTTEYLASFGEPVLSDTGAVAFVAKAARRGSGLPAGSAVYMNCGSGLVKIVRTGATAPGLAGAEVYAVPEIAMAGDSVLLLLQLKPSITPNVNVLNNEALAQYSAEGGFRILARRGDSVAVFGAPRKIRDIHVLEPVSGSPGHGRGFNAGVATVCLDFGGGFSAIGHFDETATLVTDAATASAFAARTYEGSLATGVLTQLGAPSHALDLASGAVSVAFRGTLKTDIAGPRGRETGILLKADGTSENAFVARIGDPVPNAQSLSLASVSDPVLAQQADRLAIAFTGTLSGPGVSAANNAALFSGTPTAGGALLVAREGDLAPGTDGARFGAFLSVALPSWRSAGPLFVARLASGPGVTRQNDLGLWTSDESGNLRLVLRTGDALAVQGAEKTVRAFTVLSAVPDSTGQTRSFNDRHGVAMRVTFTGGTESVVSLLLP
jgi:hypothetical protein